MARRSHWAAGFPVPLARQRQSEVLMANSNDPDIRAATVRAKAQSEMHGTEPIPPLQADRHSSLEPAVETPVEARQGFLGMPVLAVLIGGLLLAGIAWFAVHYAVQ